MRRLTQPAGPNRSGPLHRSGPAARWPAVVLPTLRATRRAPLLGTAVVGLAVVAVPAVMTVTLAPENLAVLLRLATACAAVGLAFLFDDPAKPTTATAPTPAWHGIATRTALAAAAMTVWWAAAVAVTLAGAQDGTGEGLPLRALTLETAAIASVAIAAGVVAWRLTTRGVGSPAAAPAVLVVVAILAFAPRRVAVFVPLTDPAWSAAHQRLAVLLAACLVVTAAATVLPLTTRRPPPTPSATRQSP